MSTPGSEPESLLELFEEVAANGMTQVNQMPKEDILPLVKNNSAYSDIFNKRSADKGKKKPSKDVTKVLCSSHVWDEYLSTYLGSWTAEGRLIVKTLLSMGEIEGKQISSRTIFKFWQTVQEAAPTKHCNTHSTTNDDDGCVQYINENQTIPVGIRLLALTTEQLRFLMYNVRKSLVNKLFVNIHPRLYIPVFKWLKAGRACPDDYAEADVRHYDCTNEYLI